MEEDSLDSSGSNSSIKQFNEMSRGRCKDKMLAMKHVCGLSDLQYDILVEKFCSGRTGYTRQEIAYRHNVSERTLDREYADAREKILAIVEKYGQYGYKGRFFFELDERLTGYDWSRRLNSAD